MSAESPTHPTSYWRIAVESVGGGIFTALAFASSLEGFKPEILTRPAVSEIAIGSGAVFGLVVSPVVYFTLRSVSLFSRILVCTATILGTVALTLAAPPLGLFASFGLLLLLSFIALSIHRHYAAHAFTNSNRNA